MPHQVPNQLPSTETGRAQMDRTGSFEVGLPPDDALALFTPEGERLWIEGWDPTYPLAHDPALQEGLVFQTREEAGTRTWAVTAYDSGTRRASYVYVLPARRLSMVDVAVEPSSDTRSLVTIRYRMTSISGEGDAAIDSFAAAFDTKMIEWEYALGRLAAERRPLATH